MFASQSTNYAGAKQGATSQSFDSNGKMIHRHEQPEYNDKKLRTYYLKKYRKQLKEAKKRGHKPSIKFFEAGIRFWKNKNKNLPDHLRRKADVVSKAVELAGGKMNFKNAVGIGYTDKYVEYIINYQMLGRNVDRINKIYLKAHGWLMKHYPEEIT